jgi:hypothetical protein
MSHRFMFAALTAGLLFGPMLCADDAKPPAKKPAKAATAKVVEEEAGEEKPEADLYTLPKGADVATLMKFVKAIQDFQPTSVEQARTHQQKGRVAIGDAARAVLKIEKDTKSEAYLFAKTYELGTEIRGLAAASADERQAYCDQVATLLQNPHADAQQLSLAMTVASTLERLDETALAIDAYKKFGAALAKSSDEKIAENAKMLSGAARRLELPGKPLKLAGNKFDGEKFDLANL